MPLDMRDAFFNVIYNNVKKDKNVFVMTADHGAFGLSIIEKEFPDQFLNVGIAEQNMISTAAGLAKCGKIVYAYSINNFITLRSLEQVNIDLCAMNLHVNLIGVGAGFTYSTDGPTHQGMQDMQAMMTLPNLSVYNVTDEINSEKLATLSYDVVGPKYFRIEKGQKKRLYHPTDQFYNGLCKLVPSETTYILSTGFMTSVAARIADRVKGIGVIDIYRVKPIDEERVISIVENAKNIITLEESTFSGGLGEKIAFILMKRGLKCNFLPIAVKDQHCYSYGTREMLHKQYSIDEETVYNKIINFVKQFRQ